ncbi:coiled-coil and C2 domain-containing protein 1-like [Phymastichus coffea]|uniref:coiled-coil and C2 domain-containing protein 1-like n=1 Tax=Phymastichus coffea TaxID=108790 RepID=UPI00273C8B76|nr:coiled-coil and C2 domain-containing protein 1-like [Phymastichus coffea]
MFGKRNKEEKKERRPRNPDVLAQFGIFEVPDLDGIGGSMDDGDDEDLEAELAALTAGDEPRKLARRKPPPKPVVDIDKLVNESLQDIKSDEELSGDDDDPELLNELKAITMGEVEELAPDTSEPPSDVVTNETTKLLEQRLVMYKVAEKKAKSENETSKVRRFGRGIKTLEHLLATSRAGGEIDQSEIPPELSPSAIGTAPEKPPADILAPKDTVTSQSTSASEPISPETETVDQSTAEPEQKIEESSPVNVDTEKLNILTNRQKEYKIAALAWKKVGNHDEALKNIKITKQFDAVINAVSHGETVDLSDMPPSPSLPGVSATVEPISDDGKQENESQQATQPNPAVEPNMQSLEAALKERLEVYRRTKTVAETEGNSSKARRYGRICKQFEDALKLHAKGKPVLVEDLPAPPGYPSLTAFSEAKPASVKLAPTIVEPSEPREANEPLKPSPRPSPKPSPKPSPQPSPNPSRKTPVVPPRTNSDKKKKLTTRVDKQIEALQHRQRELKIAALKAKKDGDMELARDYLRQAKGIDPLIEASMSGLPVDMKSIPLSPNAKLQLDEEDTESVKLSDDGFTIISSLDCSEATGDDKQIYDNLETQLKKQIKWCLTTRDHCKALGDVPSCNKWSRLALEYTKDLDMVRVKKRDGLPPPQHHYEIKTYSIVQSCTDLTDADIEISIIRGINYTKENDTYVIFELPLPTDTPSTDTTSTIRDTNSPEYNAVFPLTGIIDRKSRQCQRVFKRHALKCQVWSKKCSWNPILCCTHPRGFFRADSLVGTVNIKLQPLETKCILHDSFLLMDGRKAVGGKLEVKIRLRNPILTKQIEQNTDKWLAIDH